MWHLGSPTEKGEYQSRPSQFGRDPYCSDDLPKVPVGSSAIRNVCISVMRKGEGWILKNETSQDLENNPETILESVYSVCILTM